MAHLYARYLKEREDAHIIEREHGFAVYKFGKDYVYLQDIYVLPEHRQSGLGVELECAVIDEARERGFKKIFGSVDTSTSFATDMTKIMFKLGYKLSHNEANLIYMVKEI